MCANASAHADESIVFAEGSSLWRTATNGKTEPVEIVTLGFDAAQVHSIESTSDGRVLLIQTDKAVYWAVPDGDSPVAPNEIECHGAADLAKDGNCAACLDATGKIVLHRFQPTAKKTVRDITAHQVHFLDGFDLLTSDDDGLWSISINKPENTIHLAEELPGPVLPSPDGKRALGVFDAEDPQNPGSTRPTLFVFRIGASGDAKRRLGWNAVPIAWSWDSEWAVVQEAESACIVRAAGGEYKCWEGYTAVSIAPDGSFGLFTKKPETAKGVTVEGKGVNLYRGLRNGVSSGRLGLVREGVAGAAVWIPEPPAPEQEPEPPAAAEGP